MIISKTPLRMSFVGGGSDLPSFYCEEMGAVISTTIDKYVYLAVNKKFDGRMRISYSKTEEVDAVEEIQHPLVRHALKLLGIQGGIEIGSYADIPSRGSGLGSSSAYTVGLLNALYAYQHQYASKEMLARQACEIEIGLCGEPIGKQDQYAAAFGGLNLIRFHPDHSVSVDPVICKPSVVKQLQEQVLVFFTGRTRSASSVLAEQSRSMESARHRCLVRRMAALAFLFKTELEANRLESLGSMLHENWSLKTQLAGGITDPEIDGWYELAMRNGATGGKILGAGNGGFLMLLAPPERHPDICRALQFLRPMQFRFDRDGAQIVFFQPAE